MKILLLGEYSRLHNSLKEGLVALGHEVTIVGCGDKFKKLPVDYSIYAQICNENKIESRPIISGNMLKQTCYKQYGDYKNFKNSEYLHNNVFYVGLHYKVKKQNITKLTTYLNNL